MIVSYTHLGVVKCLLYKMSYNNIGLSTARGSGTNGFIQANKANVRPRDPNRERQFRRYEDSEYGTKDDLEIRRDAKRRKSAKEIVDHDAAREIEVKCMELRIQLEDDEYAVVIFYVLCFKTLITIIQS